MANVANDMVYAYEAMRRAIPPLSNASHEQSAKPNSIVRLIILLNSAITINIFNFL